MAIESDQIVYVVTASLPDEDTRTGYIDWLTGGHIQDVVGAGAARAEVAILDAEPRDPGPAVFRVEARYTFPTKVALDTYIRDHAPRLRAQGAALFGHRGVTYKRHIGPIIAIHPAAAPAHGACL